MPSIASTVLSGLRAASSRVPGPPPRTSMDATAGASKTIAVTPEARAVSSAWPTRTPAISVMRFFKEAVRRVASGWVPAHGYNSRGRCFNWQASPGNRPGLSFSASKAIGAGCGLTARNRIRGGLAWRQRHREAANQAFGAPVEFGLSAELRLDAGDHASCSEPARRRLLDPRPAGLHPYDLENVCLDLPTHRQPARQRRQRAIFGRIGDEFVQRQRHRLRRCRLQTELPRRARRSDRRSNRARALHRSACLISAPCQLDSESTVWTRASALIRPSTDRT